MTNTTKSLSDQLTDATFDAERVHPIHVAMGLLLVAERYADVEGQSPVSGYHPQRAAEIVAECREMLRIADRLVGAGNNVQRRRLDERLSRLERHANG